MLVVGGVGIAGAADRIEFAISAQPLSAALEAFSRTSRVQVLYESELAIGRRCGGAVGRFTPEAALEMLVAGSDLKVHFTRPDAVVLTRAANGDPAAPPATPLARSADFVLKPLKVEGDVGDADRFRAYAGVLRTDIERALKQDARTRSGRYSAGLRLWIDRLRAVERTELTRSTGDSARDAAIAHVLRGLMVSAAPPPRMPNPINVVITVRTL